MRKLLTLVMAGATAASAACAGAPKTKVSQGHGGTRRTLLAHEGEVRDALMSLFARDPRFAVSQSSGAVSVVYLEGRRRLTLTAYLDPGPLGDETDVEIICSGHGEAAEGRRVEREWLDRLPE